MHKHNTYVSAQLNVSQMLKSLKPLMRAGVIRTGGLKESKTLIGATNRWGMSLAALVETGAASYPDRTAIIDDDGSLTFTEVRDQGRALAKSLRSLSTADGSDLRSMSLIVRNSRYMVLGLIAAAYNGMETKILNPASSLTQLQNIALEYPSDATLIDAEFTDVIAGLDVENKIITAESSAPESSAPEDADVPSVAGYARAADLIERGATEYRNVALPKHPKQQPTVIMSSGTRGVPKAVMLPVPKTPKVLGSILDKIPFRRNDVIQLSVSMFHAWGWLNLHIGLATGSTLITHRIIEPVRDAAEMEKYRVTAIISAAVYLRDLLDEVEKTGADASTVRFIVSAGNAIPPELVFHLNKRFGDGKGVVHNFYGSTEHGQITVATAEDMLDDPTTAGRPGPGVRLAIIGEDNQPVAPGETGVIYSSNSMTSVGYLSDSDSTDVVDGMLSTGDKGFVDAKGRLYVGGRADDMVIRGGENIHPRVIEEFLLTLPQIDDVFVIGNQDDIVAKLTAYIIEAEEITDEDLNNAVLAGVSKFSALDSIIRVSELPRNDSGKVVPRLLPQA